MWPSNKRVDHGYYILLDQHDTNSMHSDNGIEDLRLSQSQSLTIWRSHFNLLSVSPSFVIMFHFSCNIIYLQLIQSIRN